jgi:23S rRNA pseudouridine1911/1915/1917 synthase
MNLTIQKSMQALDALRQLFPDSSRRTLQHWIKGGRFAVDGQLLERENQILQPGQKLQAQNAVQAKQAWDVKILYEDRYLIVIDKPENLLSVPLDGPCSKRHALGVLKDHYQTDQIFAVHRIDRETSGVLIFARGFASQEKFDALFEKHDLHREYFAVLEWRLPEDRGRWECSLLELPNFDVRISHDPNEGKKAITHYEVLRRSTKYTYALLRLETGRKHQIRVHCKEAGCPVLGDLRYGATENPIRRLCLHARQIAFKHPFTGQYLSLTSSIPLSFKKIGATDALCRK